MLRAEHRLGYLHKGTLGLLRGKSPRAAARFAARLSGDSTVAHAIAFARAAEAASAAEAPPRAVALRAVMAELERVANHLADIGAIAGDAGFAPLPARLLWHRETLLRAAMTAFGHRLMMDAVVPGGVAADIAPGGPETILRALAAAEAELAQLLRDYDASASLADRMLGTGVVPLALATAFAAGGVVGRASGRGGDLRRHPGYPPYDRLERRRAGAGGGRRGRAGAPALRRDRAEPPPAAGAAGRAARRRRVGAAAAGQRRGAGLGGGVPRRHLALAAAGRRADRRGVPARPVLAALAIAGSGAARHRRGGFSAVQPLVQLFGFGGGFVMVWRRLLTNLRHGPATLPPGGLDEAAVRGLAERLEAAAQVRLGRSLAISHVDAGSCNGCELELRMLESIVYDLERFGLRFVASPRHADVLLLTGPLTHNMHEAVLRTWAAAPDPKFVVAVGDCAIDGGVFKGSYAIAGGIDAALQVDLIVRGCPPQPAQVLDGLRALLAAHAG